MFWNSSFAEVLDLIESAIRVKRAEKKDQLAMIYLLGNNIRERFSDGKVTQLWDVFPELFAEEKAAWEKANTVPVEEMSESRKHYTEIWNKRRRGEL